MSTALAAGGPGTPAPTPPALVSHAVPRVLTNEQAETLHELLEGLLGRRLRGDPLADAVQDCFLRLLLRAHAGAEFADLVAVAAAVARDLRVLRLRQCRRRRKVGDGAGMSADPPSRADEFRAVDDRLDAARLLKRLPLRYRPLADAVWMGGEPLEDAARRLGMSRHAAARRLGRARALACGEKQRNCRSRPLRRAVSHVTTASE